MTVLAMNDPVDIVKANPAIDEVRQELISIEGIATYMDVSIHTVRFWRKRGKLPSAFRLGKVIRWHKSVIERWVIEHNEGMHSVRARGVKSGGRLLHRRKVACAI